MLQFLLDVDEQLVLVVKPFVAVAADAAAQTKEFFATVERLSMVEYKVADVALLAAGLDVLWMIERPEPVLVPAVTFHHAGCGPTVAVVAG